MNRTESFTKENAVQIRSWVLIDANGQVLGRLASRIAELLQGKTKKVYTRHVDVGDFVVVTNAAKIVLTGKKRSNKLYRHHTGWVGGIRTFTAEQLLAKKPEELLYQAVRGMLPKTILGRHMLKKLKLYAGNYHPHQAQLSHFTQDATTKV